MKRLIACLLLLVGVAASAIDTRNVSTILNRLDGALDDRQSFIGRRQAHIDSLTDLFRRRTEPNPGLLMEIADAYAGFNNDSALFYLHEGIERAVGHTKLPFKWKYAMLLPLGGYFDTAQDVFESIEPDSLTASELASYYDAGRQMNSYIAAFYHDNPAMSNQYSRKALEYQKKMLDILPRSSLEYKFNRAENDFLNDRRANARVLLEEIVDSDAPLSIRARAAHHLSQLAREEGDNNSYLYYLTVSAIADVCSATREVMSLQELGTSIYERGDVSRAYRYLSVALASAVECGAPIRIVETSRTLPIIERAHNDQLRTGRHTNYWIMAGMAMLIIVMIVMMTVLRREMRRMRQLESGLRAANTAKEVYISQFLTLCSIYMDKLNQFCKIATRKLAAGQGEELYRMTKSGKFVEEQSQEFYEVFDSAFLHIYPDFVNEVNALLQPDKQIELQPGEALNTDLRILAFMRLGIQESQRIAQVLNYSLNTIYAYRNRLKARAINRDTFESDIMRIDSIL